VTNKAYPSRLTQTFVASPRVLAAMQTFNYADPSTVQLRRLNAKQITPFIEEEQSADTERAHGGEVVGYFAFRLNTTLAEPEGGKFDPSAERFFQRDPRADAAETIRRERVIAGRSAPATLPADSGAAVTLPKIGNASRRASVWSHYWSSNSSVVPAEKLSDSPDSKSPELSDGLINEKRSKATFDLESQNGNGRAP